jgi:trimeric autotransporter adhesin
MSIFLLYRSIFWTPSDGDDDEHNGMYRQLHRTISSEESCGDDSDSSSGHEWNSDEHSDGESDADVANTAIKSTKNRRQSSSDKYTGSSKYAASSSESDADVATAVTRSISNRCNSSNSNGKHAGSSRKCAASSSESDTNIATTVTRSISSRRNSSNSNGKHAGSTRKRAASTSESDTDVATKAAKGINSRRKRSRAKQTVDIRICAARSSDSDANVATAAMKSSTSKHTANSRKRAVSSCRYTDSGSDDVMIIDELPAKREVIILSDSDDLCGTASTPVAATAATTAAGGGAAAVGSAAATAAAAAAAAAAATCGADAATAAATTAATTAAAAIAGADTKPNVKVEATAERKAERQQRRTRSSSAKQAAQQKRSRARKQHAAPAHVLAARAREQRLLKEAAQSLQVCDNPLDSILDALRGTGAESLVGEVTGRKKERVRDGNGKYHYQVSVKYSIIRCVAQRSDIVLQLPCSSLLIQLDQHYAVHVM